MTSRCIIENPIINSPFAEPARHFRFTDTGITNGIEPGRRRSTYFIPIPKPKLQQHLQTAFDLGIENRAEENRLINDIRERVSYWRLNGFQPATRLTRRLIGKAHGKAPHDTPR
jgi:type III restriction enzyme